MASRHKEVKDWPYAVKTLVTGIVGGLFWSLIWYLAYFFNFTTVGPALFWMAWSVGDWKEQPVGQWTAIGILSLVSIIITFLYRYILARVRGMWMGIFFGAILWFLIFFVANPFIIGLEPLFDMEGTTIVTTLCLFILYGLFIGYSISYEHELQQYESS
ncbi:magnesium-transporting ATPase (P-type) [Geomicrobium halophilum]|uniref:Magnesium-transporting ATPase (P-type) n=1 Tax=Geomicrobium halophilum TaxID=549000 RepID=A0A841PXY3_9BACL|nr:YqhR family membrane protein [Geomicrobium halophilum]MBB6448915.1 magnesium-transporting ATPase (P-type) [Geomicrobium halophilum]